MNNTIQFKAFVFEAYQDNSFQTYFLILDLNDNTVENVPKWDKFFSKAAGKELKVTVEVIEH